MSVQPALKFDDGGAVKRMKYRDQKTATQGKAKTAEPVTYGVY